MLDLVFHQTSGISSIQRKFLSDCIVQVQKFPKCLRCSAFNTTVIITCPLHTYRVEVRKGQKLLPHPKDHYHLQLIYVCAGATLGWTGTQIHFFQLLNHKRFHKLALVSFLHLQKISIFAKFGGCGTKTKLATPISIFNFSRAWQSYFLS